MLWRLSFADDVKTSSSASFIEDFCLIEAVCKLFVFSVKNKAFLYRVLTKASILVIIIV